MSAVEGGHVGEAIAVGVLGAAIGALVAAPIGLSLPIAAVAGVNGVVSGWRGIYDWRRPQGVIGFTLDSTWAVPMTAAALFTNAVGTFGRSGVYIAEMSERRGYHVFQGGFALRRGFAITVGNVVGGIGRPLTDRRRRLVTDHEAVHVWQARWFGLLYPLLYGGWTVAGGAAGAVVWATRRRGERFTKVVESSAYYLNPFEWWAYSREDRWPPSGKVAGMGWQRPMVRPLAARRR